MNARTSLAKERVTLRAAKLHVSETSDGRHQISIQRSLRQDDASRATRYVDDPSRFLVLSFSKSAEKYYLNQTTGHGRLVRLLERGLDDEGKRCVHIRAVRALMPHFGPGLTHLRLMADMYSWAIASLCLELVTSCSSMRTQTTGSKTL